MTLDNRKIKNEIILQLFLLLLSFIKKFHKDTPPCKIIPFHFKRIFGGMKRHVYPVVCLLKLSKRGNRRPCLKFYCF